MDALSMTDTFTMASFDKALKYSTISSTFITPAPFRETGTAMRPGYGRTGANEPSSESRSIDPSPSVHVSQNQRLAGFPATQSIKKRPGNAIVFSVVP